MNALPNPIYLTVPNMGFALPHAQPGGSPRFMTLAQRMGRSYN